MKLLIAFLGTLVFANVVAQPKVFIMDADRLVEVKKKVQQKDKSILQLVTSLQGQADSLLNMRPVSVMDKAFTPVSGNKHDYMSQAPYFWYDSTKPNGLPYMRKDGQRNPEIYKITDRTYLGNLDNASRTLALAYYLTGEEKYAQKVTVLLKHWFLNNETKMTPNLEYGQAIPGVNNGRGIGIIETVALTGIVDAVGLLNGSESWTDADTREMQKWYSQYLNWLLTSKNGNEEHAAKNNHGSWYYAQVVDFALFTGNKAKAKELEEESKTRIESQINKEGKMQLELDRTNGLGYSTMNIQAWFRVAKLGEHTGTDLWHYKNKEGATIRTAFDWLTPYAAGEKPWPYQQISSYSKSGFYALLLQAAAAYKDPKYNLYANKLDKEVDDVMIDLLYKR